MINQTLQMDTIGYKKLATTIWAETLEWTLHPMKTDKYECSKITPM